MGRHPTLIFDRIVMTLPIMYYTVVLFFICSMAKVWYILATGHKLEICPDPIIAIQDHVSQDPAQTRWAVSRRTMTWGWNPSPWKWGLEVFVVVNKRLCLRSFVGMQPRHTIPSPFHHSYSWKGFFNFDIDRREFVSIFLSGNLVSKDPHPIFNNASCHLST